MSALFRFKQFSVSDSKSAMKIGTDAILLGAIAEIGNANTILDIGTGCGIIGMMLAQRSEARIDAIDIDEFSIKEAKANFQNCPWSDRLITIYSSLQKYSKGSDKKYDLIVSNPPFFENSLKSPNPKKKLSKHAELLSHQELLSCVAKLMAPKGNFEVILPYSEKEKFLDIALIEDLYFKKELIIYPKKAKSANRIILGFSKEKQEVGRSVLTIRNADNSFTEEYISLTKDFYLKF